MNSWAACGLLQDGSSECLAACYRTFCERAQTQANHIPDVLQQEALTRMQSAVQQPQLSKINARPCRCHSPKVFVLFSYIKDQHKNFWVSHCLVNSCFDQQNWSASICDVWWTCAWAGGLPNRCGGSSHLLAPLVEDFEHLLGIRLFFGPCSAVTVWVPLSHCHLEGGLQLRIRTTSQISSRAWTLPAHVSQCMQQVPPGVKRSI